jgi:two-component system chemotaxis response regulator CheB
VERNRIERLSIMQPKCIVIGASTGGPDALVELFSSLPPRWRCPILLVQHMPAEATGALAARLQKASGHDAFEAIDGIEVEPNRIYVAPGGFHMSVEVIKKKIVLRLDRSAPRNMVRPSADFLFETAALAFKRGCVAVVLTGMGRDGCDGAAAVQRHGGSVLAQSESSCAVYGMPKEVVENKLAVFVGTPEEIGIKLSGLMVE